MPVLTLSEHDFLKILKSHNLNTPTLLRALQQAKKSHGNQKRDSGKSFYEDHALPVGYLVIQHYKYEGTKPNGVVVAAAILHDTLEDDPNFTDEEFVSLFPDEIYEIVKSLTKRGEDNVPGLTEDEIFEVNKKVLAEIARKPFPVQLIKMADRYSNIANLEELKEILPLKYERLIQDTKELFLPIAKKISPYLHQKMRLKLLELDTV